MNPRLLAALLPMLMMLPCLLLRAAPLPEFASDQQADAWFRQSSGAYRKMAEAVDRAGGYTFEAVADMPAGLAYFKDGHGHIGLNGSLKGPRRYTILVFELTNLYQEDRHQEVANRVRRGELNDAAVFALMREMIEYDSIRLHYKVLLDINPLLDPVPPEMITCLSSTARNFAEYDVPYAYDYIKAQQASGHTAHYLKLFEIHRAEYLESLPKAK